MSEILIFLSSLILAFLQTKVFFLGFHPDLVLVFFVFLLFKSLYFQGISIILSFSLKIFSTIPFYLFLIYWVIIEVIIKMWKKSFISIHKSSAFFLIIGLSTFSFLFWNFGYNFSLNYVIDLLRYISSNLVFFIPFYFFIPEIYSTEKE
uniref:Uncharacterized protein n=1 Tax=Dictyoglomus thermophilum TaxID=14 RepID=A0A7C3RID1_DICTH